MTVLLVSVVEAVLFKELKIEESLAWVSSSFRKTQSFWSKSLIRKQTKFERPVFVNRCVRLTDLSLLVRVEFIVESKS